MERGSPPPKKNKWKSVCRPAPAEQRAQLLGCPARVGGGFREEGTPAADPAAPRPEGEPKFFPPGSPAFSYHATLCGKSRRRRRRLSHPALFLAPTRLPFRWDCSLAATSPHPRSGLEEGRGKDDSWEAELRLLSHRLSFCWGFCFWRGARKPWLAILLADIQRCLVAQGPSGPCWLLKDRLFKKTKKSQMRFFVCLLAYNACTALIQRVLPPCKITQT